MSSCTSEAVRRTSLGSACPGRELASLRRIPRGRLGGLSKCDKARSRPRETAAAGRRIVRAPAACRDDLSPCCSRALRRGSWISMSAELASTSSEEASSASSRRSRSRELRGGGSSSPGVSRPLVPLPPGSPKSCAKFASINCSSAADSNTTWSPCRSPTSSPSVTWGIGSISPAAGSSSRSSRRANCASSNPAPDGRDKQAISNQTLLAHRRS
mmetsp:Transcript_22295/g.56826  ORF Transcript_22295/g.56826 Transcript_22295/m.56826 type:complete len:214 (+) Transcript_22295:144-785(+)